MKFRVSFILILPAVCICKPSSQNETLADKKNETGLDLKDVEQILSQPGVIEFLKKKILAMREEPTTTEVPPTIITTTTKVEPSPASTKSTPKESTTTSPNLKTTTTSNTDQGNSSKFSSREPLLNSTTKGISTAIDLKDVEQILSQPGVIEFLKKKILAMREEPTTTEVPPTIITTTTKVEPSSASTKYTTKESTTTSPNLKTTTTSNTDQGNSSKFSSREPLLNSTTKGISTAIDLKDVEQILSQPGVIEFLKKKILAMREEPTTTEVPPTIITTTTKVEPSPASTKSTTKESTTTSPNLKTTTTSNTDQGNSSKFSTREPLLNSTTKGISTAIDGSTDATKQAESTRISLVHHSGNFPVIFMLIIVIVVVIYFGYHNRNKIHQFIKTGYSRTKHSGGSSYVKVKLEDDIDLPPDANREYIY